MPKYVYVQVKGTLPPARIRADQAEETGRVGTGEYALVIKLGDKRVGKFNGNSVDGWWIQDEEGTD